MTTATADLLAWFDDAATHYTSDDYLRSAGIPDGAHGLAAAHIALALAGVRQALVRWHPIPAVADDDEAAALYATLGELLDARVADALGNLHTVVGTSAARSQQALMDWNRQRAVYDERALERAARAAFSEPKRVDYDTFEKVDNGDGTFRVAYRIKPEPEREGGRQP